MEQILNPGVDREEFERVWRRVMPEDRADCPFTLQQAERPQPPAPPAALPAMAAAPRAADPAEAWGGMFRQYIDGELASWRRCQALARRLSGQSGRALAAAAAGELRHAKRLSALYFLLSGVRYWPERHPTVHPLPLPAALRERFWAARKAEEAYRSAAQEAGEPRLSELFTQLAREETDHLRTFQAALEQL